MIHVKLKFGLCVLNKKNNNEEMLRRFLLLSSILFAFGSTARADITHRMTSSIQIGVNAAATQVERIGSTYTSSGSGVTLDVGGGNSADGKVGGLGTLTDGVGPVSYTHLTLPTKRIV